MIPEPLRTLAPIVVTFALLIGVLMWAFGGLLDRRNNPNLSLATGPAAAQKIVLKRNPYGQYVAPGTINGRDVTFLVDTGADHVAVPASLAQNIGLKRGAAMQVLTAGGVATAYRTQIDQISLGGIQLHNIRGSIVPAMGDSDILLGMTFLQHLDFQQKGDELVLEPGGR